jgi:hypothetical protein
MKDNISLVDKTEAKRFLALLDPDAAFFTFQTFDDDRERKNEYLTRVIHGTLDECWLELARLNERGAGIFVTVNATDGNGRETTNIVRVRALFQDLDGSPLEPVTTDPDIPHPHIVVESSPSRWHTYQLVIGMEKKDFKATQKILIARYNSDKRVHDLPRVMRVPGFAHRKGEPFLTRIVSANGAAPYPAADLVAKLAGVNTRVEVTSGLDCAMMELPAGLEEGTGLGISDSPADNLSSPDLELMAAALKAIPSKDADRDFCVRVGMATKAANAEAFTLFDKWRQGAPNYNAEMVTQKWRGFNPTEIGFGTLAYLASEADPNWSEEYEAGIAGGNPFPTGTVDAAPAATADSESIAEEIEENSLKNEENSSRKKSEESTKAEQKPKQPESHYPLILEIARKLWGESTSYQKAEFRFGTKVVNIKSGAWFDFDACEGGFLRELMQKASEAKAEPPAEIVAAAHDFPAEATIAMWDFLYGKHLLRGTVSGTAAMGGTGKSSMSIVEALAMTSGRQLLHDKVPRQLRVVLINLEDNRNTMNKRIAAVMRHYKLTKEDIGGGLVVIAKGEIKIKVAKQLRSGDVERNELIVKALTDLVIEKKADVLSIDSFIRTHKVHENDNSAIEEVVECFEDIATAADCAVHLWHHTKKMSGDNTSVESARGAMAFIDACRSVRILETMTKEAASKLKIEHASSYFRSFSGKRNFAPRLDESDWFRIASVELDNSRPLFGDDNVRQISGDNVGAVEIWHHPITKQPELAADTVVKLMEAVGRQTRWRDYPTADMWVGKAIAPVLGLDATEDAEAIKGTINKLKKMGALKETIGQDSARRDKTFVVAGDAPGNPERGPM